MHEPARSGFSYAVLRVVPRVERGEALNAGVVLYARTRGFLEARVDLDAGRLSALAPGVDPEPIERHLHGRVRIAAGDEAAGPIALLPQSERFAWLVAPSSTVIQPSPVHTGLCEEPDLALARLFDELVRV
ncbi:MAG: hypothetical protein QOJ07_3527 [Thermoleophilaceae bacterium]|nr:hypothetical protein [Thermoleophilaceae bacterium]